MSGWVPRAVGETVYVAISGERGQGYNILGVFGTRKKAKEECLKETPHGGPWHQEDGEWSADTWHSATDYVMVLRRKVRG